MPNWCNNSMVACGPEQQIRAIAAKLKVKDGKLSDFMPQPVDENGELIGGVDWQYDTWGTKWGDCDTELIDENYSSPNTSTISLGYQTPWGPASALIKEISRLHPDVTIDIEYEEPGMTFFGVEQHKGGETIFDQHHDYEFETGVITLDDGWSANFDTDHDDPKQDPWVTLNDAIHSAIEHIWTTHSLSAPKDSGSLES